MLVAVTAIVPFVPDTAVSIHLALIRRYIGAIMVAISNDEPVISS